MSLLPGGIKGPARAQHAHEHDLARNAELKAGISREEERRRKENVAEA